MQNSRINKLICNFMVIILLLSGMCFSIQGAHSLLADSFSQQHESTIHAKKNLIGQEMYLSEMMEEQFDQSVSEIFGEKEYKSLLRNFRFLGIPGLLPQNQTNLYAAVLEYAYNPGAENAVVVNFIHHSDGKK